MRSPAAAARGAVRQTPCVPGCGTAACSCGLCIGAQTLRPRDGAWRWRPAGAAARQPEAWSLRAAAVAAPSHPPSRTAPRRWACRTAPRAACGRAAAAATAWACGRTGPARRRAGRRRVRPAARPAAPGTCAEARGRVAHCPGAVEEPGGEGRTPTSGVCYTVTQLQVHVGAPDGEGRGQRSRPSAILPLPPGCPRRCTWRPAPRRPA
jgi:hypothetical protein